MTMESFAVYRRITIVAGVDTLKFCDWQGMNVVELSFTMMSQLKPGFVGIVMLSSNSLLVALTTYVVTLGLNPGTLSDVITRGTTYLMCG